MYITVRCPECDRSVAAKWKNKAWELNPHKLLDQPDETCAGGDALEAVRQAVEECRKEISSGQKEEKEVFQKTNLLKGRD